MIDLKAARQEPERFRQSLARRGAAADFDELLAADRRWRELTERVDQLRAAQKRRPKAAPTPDQIQALEQTKEQLHKAEDTFAEASAARRAGHDQQSPGLTQDRPSTIRHRAGHRASKM